MPAPRCVAALAVLAVVLTGRGGHENGRLDKLRNDRDRTLHTARRALWQGARGHLDLAAARDLPIIQPAGCHRSRNQTAPAGDTYVVAFLRVTNDKNEPVMPTRELVKLKIGPRTYPQIATSWEAKPLQPDEPAAALAAAWQVPVSELTHHAELQFNELGFGRTHGYIALPQPIPSESSKRPRHRRTQALARPAAKRRRS